MPSSPITRTVIQPVEYYRTRRDPHRVAVIAYSLGSLTWGSGASPGPERDPQSHAVEGRFQGEDRTYIEKADVTPVFRSAVDRGGVT